MEIISFIALMGVVGFLVSFTWKWIVNPVIAIIMVVLRLEKFDNVPKIIYTYFYGALLALVTLGFQQDANDLLFILYPLLVIVMLYVGFKINMRDLLFQAYAEQNHDLVKTLEKNYKTDLFFSRLLIVFYVSAILFPVLIMPLVVYLLNGIQFLISFPVLGWGLKLYGLFYVGVIFWGGLMFLFKYLNSSTSHNAS